jgi:RNA polymerase sigma-70 factor (ECF subfamily)
VTGTEPDGTLLARARSGDSAAFGELVERHRGAVFRAALAVLRNRDEADDVAQETFLSAFRKLDSFRGDASVRTWFARIAWNRALDVRRRVRFKRWIGLESADDLVARRASPETAALAAAFEANVRRAVEALPDSLRDPLLLSTAGDLSHEEIGHVLGLTPSAVKSRVFDARARIRAAFPEGARS